MAFKQKADTGAGDVFKFQNTGDSLTGVFLGSFPENGKFGPTNKYIFKTENGGLKVAFANDKAHITQLMKDVDTGSLCRLTFSSTKPSGKGNPMKLFTLEIDDEYVADPAEVEAALTAGGDNEDPYEEPVVNTPPVKAKPSGKPVSASAQDALRAKLAARKTG